MDFARFAKEAGAGGALVMPGLFGFDLTRRLATADWFDLPLMAQPDLPGAAMCCPIRSASPMP